MRKLTTFMLTAALVAFFSSSAFAQEGAEEAMKKDATSNLQIGLTGLANYSTFAYQNEIDEATDDGTGYKLGFGGGLRAIYNFTPMFGIQPEILFTQRGAEVEIDTQALSVESSTTLNYVQVPILARFNVPAGGDMITPKIVAGPTVGYFLSGTAEVGENEADIESDDVNSIDIGAAAGVGADFGVGPGSLSVDLRYFRGFTSVDDNDQDADDAVNTGFTFMLGYNYAL